MALPFYYRSKASAKKTLTCVLCMAAHSLLFSLLRLGFVPVGIYENLQLHLNMSLPLAAVVIFNFILLRVLHRFYARRRECGSTSSYSSADSYVSSDLRRLEMDKQLAFTAILIVFFLLLSHSPYYVLNLIELYCSRCAQREWCIWFRRVAIPFLFINSACNPFTYTFRISQCRRSFRIVFCKRRATIEVSPRRTQPGKAIQSGARLRKLSVFQYPDGWLKETTFTESLPKDCGIDNPQEILDVTCDIPNSVTLRKCSSFCLSSAGLRETSSRKPVSESIGNENLEMSFDIERDVFDTRL